MPQIEKQIDKRGGNRYFTGLDFPAIIRYCRGLIEKKPSMILKEYYEFYVLCFD